MNSLPHTAHENAQLYCKEDPKAKQNICEVATNRNFGIMDKFEHDTNGQNLLDKPFLIPSDNHKL